MKVMLWRGLCGEFTGGPVYSFPSVPAPYVVQKSYASFTVACRGKYRRKKQPADPDVKWQMGRVPPKTIPPKYNVDVQNWIPFPGQVRHIISALSALVVGCMDPG